MKKFKIYKVKYATLLSKSHPYGGSSIVGIYHYGDEIKATPVGNGWLRISENEYISADGVVEEKEASKLPEADEDSTKEVEVNE